MNKNLLERKPLISKDEIKVLEYIKSADFKEEEIFCIVYPRELEWINNILNFHQNRIEAESDIVNKIDETKNNNIKKYILLYKGLPKYKEYDEYILQNRTKVIYENTGAKIYEIIK